MCLLLALALPRVFLWQPLKELTRQTRQVVYAIKQSIFYMMSMVERHGNIFSWVQCRITFVMLRSDKLELKCLQGANSLAYCACATILK